MHVVSVVPIVRGTPIEELSYYTVRAVSVGDIVSVSIRNSEQKALVVRVESIEDTKAKLRSQDFTLQKLGAEPPSPLLTDAHITMCKQTALFHAASIGSAIHTLVPASIIDETPPLDRAPETKKGTFQQLALQDTFDERIAIYKNIARECMAKQESLLIIVPRRVVAERIFEMLSRGIERHVRIVHGAVSRKKTLALWEELAQNKKPTILIGTSQALTAPLATLRTIIIERESDESYRIIERPHVDVRIAATEYAKALGARIIFGDTVLRVKTYAECELGYREHYMPPMHKVRTSNSFTMLHRSPEDKGRVITVSLEEQMRDALESHKKILCIVARRGIATSVWCTDCGTRQLCPRCKAAYRLVKGSGDDESPMLTCLRCGHTESSHTTCAHCKSWKLKNYGFALDTVEHSIRTVFPKAHVISLDSSTHSEHDVKKAVTRFNEGNECSILLGTPSLLSYGCTPDITIVSSLESLLASPSYSADEDAFRTCMYIKEATSEACFIQTALRKDDFFVNLLTSHEITQFHKHEYALREQLKLPPEVIHITLTTKGRRDDVIDDVRVMLEITKPLRPRAFQELVRLSPTTFSHTTIIRVPAREWPDETTRGIIASISPVFDITVHTG